MVAFSKMRLILSIAFLAVASNAQYFADVKYERAGGRRGAHNDDDEPKSAVDQLHSSSTVWDFMAAHQKDFFSLGGYENLKEQASQVYGLMTGDKEAIRQSHSAHRRRGALRSGQGTPEQAFKRQKEFEERELIMHMLENKIVPDDIPTSNKLYEMWLEQSGKRHGVRRNDELDLIPHETVQLHAEDIKDDQDISRGRGRVLKSSINGDELTINRLEEPYPTECYNHGQLAKMTQKYYMCKSLKSSNSISSTEPFRVESETYNMLLSNYSDQYSCYTQNVENNVCVCPQGTVDFECNSDLYTRCYINITDPPFYQDCDDQPDSFYYLYSVPGFSPCFHQNFSDENPLNVEFELNCQQIDTTGLVNVKNEPDVGYDYRDVIKEPNQTPYTFVSAIPETEFSFENSSPVTVQFDFRDMKYLSNKKPFTVDLDADLAGQTKGSIPLDFLQLLKDDDEGVSRYVVGGRAFFEASVFGSSVNSFTFRGFFDQEGYEEPKSTLNQLKSSGWLWVIIFGSIAVVVLAIVLYCCCKKSKDQERQAKKAKHD